MTRPRFRDLHGSRLDLMGLDGSCLDDLCDYSLRPEFYAFMEFQPPRDREEVLLYLNKLLGRSNGETGHYWTIGLRESAKIIGTFGVLNIDWRTRSAEIGYGISPAFWGRGYFKEATALVVDYLFRELGFHRVWVKTRSDNLASVRGLEAVGFRREGIMRDFYRSDHDGGYFDATLLARLESDQSQSGEEEQS